MLQGGWPVVDGENRSELLSTDWNQEWMQMQAARHRADDSFEWDKRARHFRPLETAPYARDFIKLLALKPGESVLDMGCGAGSIAIPLAQAGHPVIAADFSPAMLGTLDAGIEYYGLEDLITPLELAWDDDWDLVGPVAKTVDVAFASRSVTTTNLKGALAKLDRTARRRCAVTMVANSSPRYDLHLMNAIGASVPAVMALCTPLTSLFRWVRCRRSCILNRPVATPSIVSRQAWRTFLACSSMATRIRLTACATISPST